MRPPPTDLNARELRRMRSQRWGSRWAREDFSPKWGARGVSREIVAAVERRWLPPEGKVLDIGCGLGKVAAWFAEQGYDALGIDFAEAAVRQARATYASETLPLRFATVDICEHAPEGGPFDILVDRGCLHGIPPPLVPHYVSNLASVCAPGARMLLFVRAFRGRKWLRMLPWVNAREERDHVRRIERIFAGLFRIDSYGLTDLGRTEPEVNKTTMPGLLFHLIRE